MHRAIGELKLESGDRAGALAEFDQALALNPKVGVAKQAAKLRNELG